MLISCSFSSVIVSVMMRAVAFCEGSPVRCDVYLSRSRLSTNNLPLVIASYVLLTGITEFVLIF